MDVWEFIKDFIKTSKFHASQNRNESLIQKLQVLSAVDDLPACGSKSLEVLEFYSLLRELFNHHPPDSDLVWCAVSVLQVAIRNPATVTALINTYHFIHPLTSVLEAQITLERKLVVLRIIQELSYGVVICWQEVHLPKLIGLLLDIIMSSDKELIPEALGVMVNLCHNNQPALQILMNSIDMKVFLKKLLNLNRDNVETSVMFCKLMMVLNQLTCEVPDEEILSFVRVYFLKINKAFKCGNARAIRHIVDFFHLAKESEHGRKVLLTYPKYEEEVENLVNEFSKKEVPNNSSCVQQLIKFFHELVDLELQPIISLFPKLVCCILPWIQVTEVGPTVFKLLTTLLSQSKNRDSRIYKALINSLKNSLQDFVKMLHEVCQANSVDEELVSSLLHFCHELAADPHISTDLANTVDKDEIKKLFLPLMNNKPEDEVNLFQPSVASLYVEVLSFVSKLSMDDKEWLFLYSDLLQKKQILRALAIALYSGSFDVKKQILYLAGTSGFSNDCLSVLSKYLVDLNQLYLFSPKSSNQIPDKRVTYPQFQMDCMPNFTRTHRERLDSLMEKLDDLLRKNEIQHAPLSEVIELYNFKLGEMRRAERCLQSSLSAGDHYRSRLTQQVAHLSAETGRLHQLLQARQATLEGTHHEMDTLRQQLHIAQQSANSTLIKLKQAKQDISSKSLILKEQNDETFKLKHNIEELSRKCAEIEQASQNLADMNEKQSKSILTMKQQNLALEEKIEELNKTARRLEADKSELQTVQTNLEGKLSQREKVLLEKEALIESKICQLRSLEQEKANQQAHIKELEKSTKEKDKELSAQQTQLLELEKMRKIIFEITGGKKNTF